MRATRQFITIFDKGPGMNKAELKGWAEVCFALHPAPPCPLRRAHLAARRAPTRPTQMAHKTSDRMDLNIIRDADKLEADNARVDEYGFPLAPFQAGA